MLRVNFGVLWGLRVVPVRLDFPDFMVSLKGQFVPDDSLILFEVLTWFDRGLFIINACWLISWTLSFLPHHIAQGLFFWQHIRPMQGFNFNVSSLTDVNLLAIWLGCTDLVAMTIPFLGWLPYVTGFRQAPPQRPPAAMPNAFEGQRQTSGTSEGTAVRDLQCGEFPNSDEG